MMYVKYLAQSLARSMYSVNPDWCCICCGKSQEGFRPHEEPWVAALGMGPKTCLAQGGLVFPGSIVV